MRRAAKVDANQAQIVKALREAGCTVQSLAAVGDGCPDLLVGCGNRTALIECKDGSKPPSARRLNPEQMAWHAEWRGGTLATVFDVDSALQVVRIMKA